MKKVAISHSVVIKNSRSKNVSLLISRSGGGISIGTASTFSSPC